MKDCATDVGPGEGFEGSPYFRLVQLGGPQQAHEANLYQVIEWLRAAAAVVDRNWVHQTAVLVYSLVALLQSPASERFGFDRMSHGV
jgi:hypothetical protein